MDIRGDQLASSWTPRIAHGSKIYPRRSGVVPQNPNFSPNSEAHPGRTGQAIEHIRYGRFPMGARSDRTPLQMHTYGLEISRMIRSAGSFGDARVLALRTLCGSCRQQADVCARQNCKRASRPRWRSKASSLKPASFVAIPILPVRAATPGADGDEVPDLDQLKPEAIWAAPTEWCPNPAATISLRVVGNSMSPLILDGYIIAVDTSDISRDDLVGQIVVARNTEEKRLLVSRLIRFDHTDALVSDQREHQSVSLADESDLPGASSVGSYGGPEKLDNPADKVVGTSTSRSI